MASSATYPLLPYSQLVYDSTRWMPHGYRFPMTFIWKNGAAEKERIEQAIRTALMSHPVFSMRINRDGTHYAAPLKDILHGRYHDVRLTLQGAHLVIETNMSRILGDGRSTEILLEDALRAYERLPLEKDDYWGYLEYVEQQKQSPHYQSSSEWLMDEFADESIPVRPTTDRHLWTLLPPKAGLYQADYTDLRKRINHLTKEEHLSMDGFFSLSTALAIAEYCGADSAALTWAYEGRERPEEQRIYGSLHRDIPFQIKNLKSGTTNQKSNLIREARNQIRSGIAHSDYPYTLTAPYNQRWNYAVNVLRVPDEKEIVKRLPKQVELQPFKAQKYAYALLDVEIYESEDGLALWFRYSATHYKQSSIRRFAELVKKNIIWLLSD